MNTVIEVILFVLSGGFWIESSNKNAKIIAGLIAFISFAFLVPDIIEAFEDATGNLEPQSVTAPPVETDAPPARGVESYLADARTKLEAGDNAGAISYIEAALRISPKNPEGLDLYGQALYRSNNLERAASYYEQASNIDPSNADYKAHIQQAQDEILIKKLNFLWE